MFLLAGHILAQTALSLNEGDWQPRVLTALATIRFVMDLGLCLWVVGRPRLLKWSW
jgi:hypothetical protein